MTLVCHYVFVSFLIVGIKYPDKSYLKVNVFVLAHSTRTTLEVHSRKEVTAAGDRSSQLFTPYPWSRAKSNKTVHTCRHFAHFPPFSTVQGNDSTNFRSSFPYQLTYSRKSHTDIPRGQYTQFLIRNLSQVILDCIILTTKTNQYKLLLLLADYYSSPQMCHCGWLSYSVLLNNMNI